jgi:hypothetical protein
MIAISVVALLHSVIGGDIIRFHLLLPVIICLNGSDCVFAAEWMVEMSPMFDVTITNSHLIVKIILQQSKSLLYETH